MNEDKFGNTLRIKNEDQLPDGEIISAPKDELELNEKMRREYLVWDVSRGERKMVWLLSVASAYNSATFMQIQGLIKNSGYEVAKKGIIDQVLLVTLYNRRTAVDTQKEVGDNSAAAQFFEKVITDALNANVSDVHIEVRETTGGLIRMRKNGEMVPYNDFERLTFDEANNLCSVIYNVLASTKSVSFDAREYQEASVSYTLNKQELRLRYQSMPAYPGGYDVVLRLLLVGRSEDFTPLQKLGFTEQQSADLLNITARPVGSLIIAGVTGSGKSTTLKNLLMHINAHNSFRIKIYSIEDPPEYNIAKITQIPVVRGKDFDPEKMSPFEAPIKACMRGDPDIIMVGEVRDKTTGDLVKKAIQSGHQVLTTTHTTSALGIIERFQDFGLTRPVLGAPDFLTGLLYQKLMPVLCDHCSVDLGKRIKDGNATDEMKGIYKRIKTVVPNPEDYPIRMRNQGGCQHCGHTGIKGRTVCAEVIKIDYRMLSLIAEGKTIETLQYWRSLSDKNPVSPIMTGKTCMEHAFQKCLEGICCPFEVEGSFKPIDEMLQTN